MKNLNSQAGFFKEIIVAVAVIFVLAYFGLDPQTVWEKIVSIVNASLAYFK